MHAFHFPRLPWIALWTTVVLLTGCAGVNSRGETQAGRIQITSDPAGAVAYADGIELGATPIEIVPGNVFRSGFVGFSYRYFGTLTIKKPGCETWSTEVNDNILSRTVHARLKCDPDFQPAAAPVTHVPSGDPVMERLERIDALHKKGLISDEEYRQLRTRIIDRL